jgi:hypothetical protein
MQVLDLARVDDCAFGWMISGRRVLEAGEPEKTGIPRGFMDLVRDGVEDAEGNVLWKIISGIRACGYDAEEIWDIVATEPNGIAKGYGERLRGEVESIYAELQKIDDNKSGPRDDEKRERKRPNGGDGAERDFEARVGKGKEAARRGLPLTLFADACAAVHKEWIIVDVMALGEISSWFGPPGAAKSAALTDIAVHVASLRAWRGYKIKKRYGVVYFAMERAGLTKRRLRAYRIRDNLPDDLPIAVCSAIIDLMDPKSVGTIFATIREAERAFRCEVGLVVFDTFSKGIAAGGGDEDKARDQNRVNANMRRVLEIVNIHIAGIGHTGKDESRGERGSNARQADVDLEARISGEQIRSVVIEKANDQMEGPLTTFALEPTEIGRNEDGDPTSVAIVSQDMGLPASTNRAKATGQTGVALRLLEKAIAEGGQHPPASNHMPDTVLSVTLSLWEGYCDRGMAAETNKPDSKRRAFVRALTKLQSLRIIGVWNEWVWIADKPDKRRTS